MALLFCTCDLPKILVHTCVDLEELLKIYGISLSEEDLSLHSRPPTSDFEQSDEKSAENPPSPDPAPYETKKCLCFPVDNLPTEEGCRCSIRTNYGRNYNNRYFITKSSSTSVVKSILSSIDEEYSPEDYEAVRAGDNTIRSISNTSLDNGDILADVSIPQMDLDFRPEMEIETSTSVTNKETQNPAPNDFIRIKLLPTSQNTNLKSEVEDSTYTQDAISKIETEKPDETIRKTKKIQKPPAKTIKEETVNEVPPVGDKDAAKGIFSTILAFFCMVFVLPLKKLSQLEWVKYWSYAFAVIKTVVLLVMFVSNCVAFYKFLHRHYEVYRVFENFVCECNL